MILLSGMAALALAACQNDDTKVDESSNTQQNKQVSVKEQADNKETKENKETNEQVKEIKETEKVVTEKKDTEESKTEKDEQKGNESQALKAEDVIVNYFNAISTGDVSTLEKLYPSAVEENNQMDKLFQSSKVTADIIEMKKVSLDDKEARYKVKVKIYTKQDDPNFTNNTSDYELILDLTSGTLKTKSITSTDYLE